MLRWAVTLLLWQLSLPLYGDDYRLDIYSQAELLTLIQQDKYLQQVQADDCQLVQDIEARADILQQPLYQFLWGEMLNFGICVPVNPSRGMVLLRAAAEQGSPEAMVQLAKYYQHGRFVVQNKDRAVQYVLPAAANGSQPARMMLVRLMAAGYGSPRDYEQAYHWLFNEVFSDDAVKLEAMKLLQGLEVKMPASVVERARNASLTSR
ncbi:flagellar rotation associated protein MotX [Shewanella sp. NFH-SH190041]|uniref:tetratricopeptide repeat protein n=1 Tax=Shewanella sp. NFH-SH190041 TaxID=2950245 RepID=UPI0021C352F4|nr:tetratricopeptide repeat protein [Shewanella sp. NFH-SH190041]BDM65821.1 flagellar rotation associated protein MotX [Shewanella sp. NFH-SH190041]